MVRGHSLFHPVDSVVTEQVPIYLPLTPIIMASKPSEAALLNDIASLAALINKHKSAAQAPLPFGPYSYSSSSYKLPPPVTQKKFSNLSLKPQSLVPLQPNTTPVIQTQQLIHKNPYKLVKPKPIPNIPPATTAIPPSTKQTRPATPNSYIRRGNKLVRKSILKLQTSPHKKFILKSPSATKSISSSPSIRVKQMMANAQSPGLYKRHLTLNPALASRKPVSLLTAYFRLSKNSLVRKTSNKYIRPGAVIAIKKPLGTNCSSTSSILLDSQNITFHSENRRRQCENAH